MLDLVDSPIRFVHTLYNLSIEKAKTDEGKEEMKAEAIGDALGGMM